MLGMLRNALDAATQPFRASANPDREEAIKNLQNQLLAQWSQIGVPSIGGGVSIEQRARSLADRLYANQIYDISRLSLSDNANTQVPVYSRVDVRYTDSGPEYGLSSSNGEFSTWTPLTPEQAATVITRADPEGGLMAQYQTGMRARNPDEVQQQLVYDGRRIGFLGNADDGGRNADPTGYLQPGGLASWTASGKGAVGYTARTAPNGQVYFVPSWGSTSDLATVAPLIGAGLMFIPGLQGVGASLGTALGASGTAATALGNALIQGTLAEAAGGDFLRGAAAGAIGAYAPGVSSTIAENLGGGVLGAAVGQGLTSAGTAALVGGDATQAGLIGALTGAANYTPPDVGMNSPLTMAQIESGLGTEGYGYGAQAAASGLFDPSVIGSGAYLNSVGSSTGPDNIDIGGGWSPASSLPDVNPYEVGGVLGPDNIDIGGGYNTALESPLPNASQVPWDKVGKLLGGLFTMAAAPKLSGQPVMQQPSMAGYMPAETMPLYSPEYYQQVQQYYNTYLPTMPRDVASPLQDWYSSGYEQPDSVTARLFPNGV